MKENLIYFALFFGKSRNVYIKVYLQSLFRVNGSKDKRMYLSFSIIFFNSSCNMLLYNVVLASIPY